MGDSSRKTPDIVQSKRRKWPPVAKAFLRDDADENFAFHFGPDCPQTLTAVRATVNEIIDGAVENVMANADVLRNLHGSGNKFKLCWKITVVFNNYSVRWQVYSSFVNESAVSFMSHSSVVSSRRGGTLTQRNGTAVELPVSCIVPASTKQKHKNKTLPFATIHCSNFWFHLGNRGMAALGYGRNKRKIVCQATIHNNGKCSAVLRNAVIYTLPNLFVFFFLFCFFFCFFLQWRLMWLWGMILCRRWMMKEHGHEKFHGKLLCTGKYRKAQAVNHCCLIHPQTFADSMLWGWLIHYTPVTRISTLSHKTEVWGFPFV